MRNTTKMMLVAGVSLAGFLALAGTAVQAADAAPNTTVEEVIVTGTRQTGLKVVDSPAPIQVVDSEALVRSGQTDLRLGLSNLIPSFTAQAFGGDTANLTLSARLRGLSPNQALVLVNGKRRHTTANLAVLGGAYQGAAAADLSFIPSASIGRVEVLTDGAAAQYGTDAIAGVINIIQKKNSSGGTISATGGKYIDEGGETAAMSFNLGTAPIEGSYMNMTAETKYHDFSNRGRADQRTVNPSNPSYTSARNAVESKIPGYPNLNLISGDAEYRLSTFAFNAGVSLPNDGEIYTFGSYGHKDASAYENYRRYYRVAGKSSTDLPFPNGFNPRERIIEDDYAFTLGTSGVAGGWNYDLASTWGMDDIEVRVEDSANASLYYDTSTTTTKGYTPTSFHAGTWTTTQLTNTLDISRDIEVGMATPLNLAFGAEQRSESYEIGQGDAASTYKEGSQSYPGFSKTDAGRHTRNSYAAYTDLAVSPTTPWKIDAALRFEHFSDFGDTTIAKLTSRYDFSDAVAVRGTISSGFRAPTLAESYYSATNVSPTSAFVQLAPNSSAARLLKIDKLKPEKSINFSLGMVAHPLAGVTATVDIYQITLTDRIFGSSSIYGLRNGVSVSSEVTAAIKANGNVLDSTVTNTGINIFSNGLDTRSRGLDMVVSYTSSLGDLGKIAWTFSGNLSDTKVTKVKESPSTIKATSTAYPNGQTMFSLDARSYLETAAPKYKVGITSYYTLGSLSLNLVNTFYGESSAYVDPGNGLTKVVIDPALITDIELAYKLPGDVTVAVGANNAFNHYPTKFTDKFQSDCNAAGNTCVTQYPGFSPYGINGGYYYGRLSWSF